LQLSEAHDLFQWSSFSGVPATLRNDTVKLIFSPVD